MRRFALLAITLSFMLSACAGRQGFENTTPSVLPDAHVKPFAVGISASHVDFFNVGSDPKRDAYGFDIVVGPDGNLYYGTLGPLSCNPSGFCSSSPGNVGRFELSGSFTELPLSGPPLGLLFTPDGALWAGEESGPLARITSFSPAAFQEIPVPNPSNAQDPGPRSLAYGPDGDVWFTLTHQARIAKIPASGPYTSAAITPYAVPSGPAGTPRYPARPWGIVTGPDSNLWFADELNGVVYKSTTSGALTGFITPPQKALGSSASSFPAYLSVSSGKMYVTFVGPTSTNGYLYQLATWGSFGNIGISPGAVPYLTRAGGGLVAYSDLGNGAVGMLDAASGTTREIPTAPIGTVETAPNSVAVAPDGSIWFMCYGGTSGKPLCIGHVVLTSVWSVFPGTSITLERGKTTLSQLIGIAETGNSGPFTVTSSNPAVVTVTAAPHEDHNFVLHPAGYSRAFVYVRDSHGRTVKLIVTVTRT